MIRALQDIESISDGQGFVVADKEDAGAGIFGPGIDQDLHNGFNLKGICQGVAYYKYPHPLHSFFILFTCQELRGSFIVLLAFRALRRLGRQEQHRRTIRALGIKRHQQSVIHEATPAIEGMIRKVSFMVKVEEVEA